MLKGEHATPVPAAVPIADPAASPVAEQRLRHELENRVRNSLAMVRSIARRSVIDAESVEDYQCVLDGRLACFLRVQAATFANPAGVDLELLLSDELVAMSIRTDGPVAIGGPDVRLNVRAAECIGLIFHELAMAAALFGACSRARGRLKVEWSIDPRDLTIRWSERGGRSRHLPEQGFAADMLHDVLRYEFAGTSEIRHCDMGVDYAFTLSRALATLPAA